MKIDYGRKLYTIAELYRIVYHGIRTMKYMRRAKKKGDLGMEFQERIMLAVTEVNGCAICSYAHTRMALEAGMSDAEIQNMLAGETTDIPAEELQAVLFAQHYADSRGNPSREAWDRIVDAYGAIGARGILGAARAMMIGNAYGIPWSSFFNRFRGKPDQRSSLLYEIGVISVGSLAVPVAIVHALTADVFHVPLIDFS